MPGFRDYPDGFQIEEYELDADHWTAGFGDVYRYSQMRSTMNRHVAEEASQFVQRASAAGRSGRLGDLGALVVLNAEMGNRIPEWLISLITTVPLCGLEVDWQANNLDGSIEWADANGIRSESIECYPGLAILERGFVNIGCDPFGSGDSYFIPTDRGDNPPVFQVYHDVSDQPDEILSRGLFEVSPRLSDLFRSAKRV
jgi:hypothetical protein